MRIDPADGSQHLLADLSRRKNFPNNLDPFPQGGLMGLALHPQLLTGKPYVYLAYVHRFDGCLPGKEGCFFKTKLVRFTYSITGDSLSNEEEVLIDTLPGSSDHNGGRIAIGPVGNSMYLFYSIGDMGAGHAGNGDRTHHGQEIDKYEGKILRFNLEPDTDTSEADRLDSERQSVHHFYRFYRGQKRSMELRSSQSTGPGVRTNGYFVRSRARALLRRRNKHHCATGQLRFPIGRWFCRRQL